MYLTIKYQAQQVQALLRTKHAFWNKNKNLNHQQPENMQSNTNYFTKFHDFSVFFKFHDFSMHGTFFCDFQGFPVLVGTLLMLHTQSPNQVLVLKGFTKNGHSSHLGHVRVTFCKTFCKQVYETWVQLARFWENHVLIYWLDSNISHLGWKVIMLTLIFGTYL